MNNNFKLSERIKRGPHNDPAFMEWVVEQVEAMEKRQEEECCQVAISLIKSPEEIAQIKERIISR